MNLRPGGGRAWLPRRQERLDDVLREIAVRQPHLEGVRPLRRARVESGTTVLLGRDRPEAILRLAAGEEDAAGLRRQVSTLQALHADMRLEGWSRLVPRIEAWGELHGPSAPGTFYTVETVLPGVPAPFDAGTRGAAGAAIGEMHRRTGEAVTVDGAVLEEWTEPSLALLDGVAGSGAGRVREEMRSLLGARILTGRVHGDFWLGNVLVEDGMVSGIVDWDRAGEREPCALDMVHLVLYDPTRAFGETVRENLDSPPLLELQRALAAEVSLRGESDPTVPMRPLILLCWLRHVAQNLTQSRAYYRDRRWYARNVEAVLCSL